MGIMSKIDSAIRTHELQKGKGQSEGMYVLREIVENEEIHVFQFRSNYGRTVIAAGRGAYNMAYRKCLDRVRRLPGDWSMTTSHSRPFGLDGLFMEV